MAYQMTINLTDQEYAALIAEAKKSGKQPETLLREIMMQRLQPSPHLKRPLTSGELMEKQYREVRFESIYGHPGTGYPSKGKRHDILHRLSLS